MSDVRFAKIDSTSHVDAIIFGPAAWVGVYPYLFQSDTAQLGDYWDGTTFSAPVIPPPTRDEMAVALRAFIQAKETARQSLILDSIIDGDPPETMDEFMTRLQAADPS